MELRINGRRTRSWRCSTGHPTWVAEVPFAWGFADPHIHACALAATGPAYEAIRHVGEAAFELAVVEQARECQREGLTQQAELNVVGYLARNPAGAGGRN